MKYAIMNNPAAETAGPLKIEYLCSLSFPLVGNPSDSPLVKGVIRGCFKERFSMRVFARIATTGPSKMTAGKQSGMTEIESIVDT